MANDSLDVEVAALDELRVAAALDVLPFVMCDEAIVSLVVLDTDVVDGLLTSLAVDELIVLLERVALVTLLREVDGWLTVSLEMTLEASIPELVRLSLDERDVSEDVLLEDTLLSELPNERPESDIAD